MDGNKNKVRTIDEYISQFPPEIQEKLQQMRNVIREAAPGAEEAIKWQMPTFVLIGNLVQFAAHTKHIGFYPGPVAVEAFKEKLTDYKWSKGTIQFPYEKPLPQELLSEIVKFETARKVALAESKTKKKKNGEIKFYR